MILENANHYEGISDKYKTIPKSVHIRDDLRILCYEYFSEDSNSNILLWQICTEQ